MLCFFLIRSRFHMLARLLPLTGPVSSNIGSSLQTEVFGEMQIKRLMKCKKMRSVLSRPLLSNFDTWNVSFEMAYY